MDYFEQAAADSAPFITMIERYGVAGVVSALLNYVNTQRSGQKCSNGCALNTNVGYELSKCAKAIRRWNEDAADAR